MNQRLATYEMQQSNLMLENTYLKEQIAQLKTSLLKKFRTSLLPYATSYQNLSNFVSEKLNFTKKMNIPNPILDKNEILVLVALAFVNNSLVKRKGSSKMPPKKYIYY